MDADLLRQRRNLIGISIALILYEITDASLKKIPTFLGAVDVNNTQTLIIFLWATFFYFIWRYWQYTLQASLKPTELTADLNIFNRELHYRLVESEEYKALVGDVTEELITHRATDQQATPILRRGVFKRTFDFSVMLNKNNRTSNRYNSFSAPFTKNILNVNYFKIFLIELKAQIQCVIKGTAFTDYYLPYIAAFTATTISVYSNWEYLSKTYL